LLWQGQPLPATQTEGLRYSDRPLVPSLSLNVGMRGVATYYSSDDLQESIEGRISLSGQLGRLQRNTFDYTQFNIGLAAVLLVATLLHFCLIDLSTKLVLSGGIVQQIYGPFSGGLSKPSTSTLAASLIPT
jgi:hypothetical protein